ncbi:MAG TPA: nitroreductase family protein [Gammaproteobacteria bacterium]|nr:nitroreductase family protein [Gammaproteobacteria bacterium]
MSVRRLIEARFGLQCQTGASVDDNDTLGTILSRRSRRDFRPDAVPEDLLHTLFAAAFSAPSKSDLQQACVIRIADRDRQRRIAEMKDSTRWAAEAPVFLVWCGDSRRIRRLAEWRGHPFANDHLDAFMNAAVDAGICMQTFMVAAESVGLGCCPVSEIRDHIEALSDELELPPHVFPVAGLAVGWPRGETGLSMRLPPTVTVHENRYDDAGMIDEVSAYDRRREASSPTPPESQRLVEEFGVADDYGWSENRTRQYSKPARADFGRYIRKQGFKLE